jgi:hypothetical protein
VLTLKVLFPRYGPSLQHQGDWGRRQLLTTPFPEYERQIRTLSLSPLVTIDLMAQQADD